MVPAGVVNKYPWSVVVKLNFPRATHVPIDGEDVIPSRQEFGSEHMNGITAVEMVFMVAIGCCPRAEERNKIQSSGK